MTRLEGIKARLSGDIAWEVIAANRDMQRLNEDRQYLIHHLEKAIEMAHVLQMRYHHSHFSNMQAKKFLKGLDEN